MATTIDAVQRNLKFVQSEVTAGQLLERRACHGEQKARNLVVLRRRQAGGGCVAGAPDITLRASKKSPKRESGLKCKQVKCEVPRLHA